jgi:hypothetical protein
LMLTYQPHSRYINASELGFRPTVVKVCLELDLRCLFCQSEGGGGWC